MNNLNASLRLRGHKMMPGGELLDHEQGAFSLDKRHLLNLKIVHFTTYILYGRTCICTK